MLRSGGLTITQYSLLKNLKRLGVCSTSELAKYVGLERTTLVRNIKPLFQKRFIEDISPEGTRNRQIQVTSTGTKVLELCRPLWEEAQKGIELKIGSENVQLLTQLVAKIEDI
ncbi:putative transcriptional regulator [Dehalobacter sp. DCA]|jgi:Transcriptional regulators|nr:putative transcriptional regulator [Dehalobacter sp. DCA]